MVKKAVLFDMDGVVIDNLPYHVDAWLVYCERHGIPLTREIFYKDLNGLNSKYTFEWLLKRKLSREEIVEFEEEKELIYREFYAPFLTPALGLLAFINQLKSAGIKTALGTSAGPGNIDFILDGLGIRDQFDAVIGGAEVTKGKPDPEIYLRAAGLVEVNPENCWVIEDSLQGIEAGLSAGMKVVGMTTSHSSEELSHTYITSPDFVDLFQKMFKDSLFLTN
jgi:HAD superfamily hydrolase (TIGR01509 family)